MMLAELVKKARSVRRFDQTDPIPYETLENLVDLARLSPCSGNSQRLRYMIIHTTDECEVLFPLVAWAAALPNWSGPAEGERPTGYIVILSEAEDSTNAGIAAQTIQLAATEAGYGACMMGAIKRDAIKAAFHIPEVIRVLLVIAIGKPAETVVIEPMPPDGRTAYWRSKDDIHHVPKRSLEDVIVDYNEKRRTS